MKLGNKSIILTIFLIFFFNTISISEDKILSTPLINLNKLKPSFEDPNEVINESNNKELIKNKKKLLKTILKR